LEPWTRRALLQRAGLLASTFVVGNYVGVADLLEDARATVDDDLKRDTFRGLAAFVLPGRDGYSTQQGVTAKGRGGVEARAMDGFIRALDLFLPFQSQGSVPLSGPVALLLNDYALQVNPTAFAAGPFPTPFSNLQFREKGEVFHRLETDATVSDAWPELKFVAGAIPTFTAMMFVSEAGHYDAATRTLDGWPVGWEITGYGGGADGHNELKGWYRGVKTYRESGVCQAPRCKRRRHRHGSHARRGCHKRPRHGRGR
jgi:hypothetical protein